VSFKVTTRQCWFVGGGVHNKISVSKTTIGRIALESDSDISITFHLALSSGQEVCVCVQAVGDSGLSLGSSTLPNGHTAV